MRIAWIVSAQPLQMTPGGFSSSFASYRYRAIIPAKGLKKRGHQVFSIAVSPAAGGLEHAMQQLQGADVAVFGKMVDLPLQIRLVKAARESGVGTVVDICDDHFSDGPAGDTYRAVAASGDAISVSSRFLAARIAQATGQQSTVIKDPFEGVRGEPKWMPGTRIVATWFGHPMNMTGLAKSFDKIEASGIPMRLVVVTRGDREVIEWCRRASARAAANIDLEFREWSLKATARALQECDLVLLPIHAENRFFLSKGPNRVVESLWAGRFVVAHRLPAYEDFGEWAWVGDDIAAGLDWTIKHSPEIVGRITRAQDYIADRYSPESVATAWDDLLTQINMRRTSRTG